jgi:hypothetical protein
MLNSTTGGTSVLIIYNIIGAQVLSQNLNLTSGSNTIPVDVSSLPSSLYFIKIGDNGNLRFIKK